MIDVEIKVNPEFNSWLAILPKAMPKVFYEEVQKSFQETLEQALDQGMFGVKSIESNATQLKDSMNYEVGDSYMIGILKSAYGVMLEKGGTIKSKTDRGMAVPVGTKEQQRATRYPEWKSGKMVWLKEVNIPEYKWFSQTVDLYFDKWTPGEYMQKARMFVEPVGLFTRIKNFFKRLARK